MVIIKLKHSLAKIDSGMKKFCAFLILEWYSFVRNGTIFTKLRSIILFAIAFVTAKFDDFSTISNFI